MSEYKPLNWTPKAGIGYTVVRRTDGGMHFTFIDASPATLAHWREFSLAHLYDLRALDELPEAAVQFAVEVNSDPSVRNIRLAVVATSPNVKAALRKVSDLTTGGVEMALFTTMDEAEAWLSRPLTLRV